MKRVIIIPTYNEAQNIRSLISVIHSILPEVYIVVVDDNSPDGTGNIVKDCAQANSQVSLIFRKEKKGLGQAYIHAISTVLKDGDVGEIVLMDADFSHNPEYLRAMLEKLSKNDVVIGSRYARGGQTHGWELWRRILSYLANFYCRMILRMGIRDVTSGFYAIKAEILRKCDFSAIDASGYAFQIEFKYLLFRQGSELLEFPIVFENRVGGESKISGHIISEGVLAPWRMLFRQ